jgi:hypothetical protein
MPMKKKKKMKIKQATVDAFSKKLREWSKTLPEDERDLVRLLVLRATSINVGDLGNYDLTAKIAPDAEKLFKSFRGAIRSIPSATGVNLEPGDISWARAFTTVPDWKNAAEWGQQVAARVKGSTR